MWWKVYFWIYSVITALFVLLSTVASWNFAMYEGFLESVFLILGTYSFVFKKKIVSPEVWKFVFIWIIIFWAGSLIYYQTKISVLSFLETAFLQSARDVQTTIIISVPALIAIYRLGFAAKKK